MPILSALMLSGVLPLWTVDLNINELQTGMTASAAAGLLLGIYSPMGLAYFAIILSIAGLIISFLPKKL